LAFTAWAYLDDPKEAVVLNARMGQLTDGTTYVSDITVVAKAKDLQVAVRNSGYPKMT
jgi:hypothetical protein